VSIDIIKNTVDLVELAERLKIKRQGSRGNYFSPHHKDTNASLSIYAGGRKWRDHSSDQGGDCIELVRYTLGLDVGEAIAWLREQYGIPAPRRDAPVEQREKSKSEYIADQCLRTADPARAYLTDIRKLPAAAVDAAIKARTVGFNDYRSNRVEAGSIGYGGPAVAFIVRDIAGVVQAVDMRFIDPQLNGGLKTQSHGEKAGFVWCMDWRRFKTAERVYVVESAINALCVDAAGLYSSAAIALRGVANVRSFDWRALIGKQVIVCMDADTPKPDGTCPGPESAWAIYEACIALDISCMLVDQADWYTDKINDLNDLLKARGITGVKEALNKFEPWAIAGLPGKPNVQGARSRLFLPANDYAIYWRYRCKPDFTTYVKQIKDDEEAEGGKQEEFGDLCGFRIASLSRIQTQSAIATMTGEKDQQPNTVFSASVQTPRHGTRIQRRVLTDDRVHNIEHWKKIGPIFEGTKFSRMITILERGAHLGARDAVNFVGLAWRAGKPTVVEGPDTFFSEPEKQCPYHNLIFPSGTKADAVQVLRAYGKTFQADAASILLTWALGAHIKAFIGFWPHMCLQADKGAGKSTLIKRLERTIAFTMFGGQSLETQFRLLTSVSHTSHPVGWEEISARKQEVINGAQTVMQESYQHVVTRRGADLLEFVQCAPVLVVGEDVPLRSLTGKMVRADISLRQGTPLPDNLPRFPLREWLHYLAEQNRTDIIKALAGWEAWLKPQCRAEHARDPGASRMVTNYAALLLANALLREFCGYEDGAEEFQQNLVSEMNSHIKETSSEREPWIWILETIIAEIDAGKYPYPHDVIVTANPDLAKADPLCLVLRPEHIMQHLAHSNGLRGLWDSLPVKSSRVLGAQLERAGVVLKKTWDGKIKSARHQHMWALPISELAKYGLYVSTKIEA